MKKYDTIKSNQLFKPFLMVKKSCTFFIVFISLLILTSKVFSANNDNFYPLTIINNKVNDRLNKPFNNIKTVINLIDIKLEDASNNKIDDQQLRGDFEWVFETEGISYLKPVVSAADGTVYVSSINSEISFDLRELLNNGTATGSIGTFESKLFSLKPGIASRRARENWTFDSDGLILFPPVVSDEGNIFIETFNENIDILDRKAEEFNAKITSIDGNGNKLWDRNFENSIFLTKPTVESDLILTTTLNLPDRRDIFDDFDINLDNFSGVVSSIDSLNGDILWSFNPADIGTGSQQLFIVTSPTISDDQILINTVNITSEDEIKNSIETSIEKIEDETVDSITNSLLGILDVVKDGGDTEPALNEIENELETIIDNTLSDVLNDILNLGKIFALDFDGNVKWESKFSGASLTSPVVDSAGFINVNSANILLEDVSSDVDIKIALSQDDILEADVNLTILISGASINIPIEVKLDVTSSDPLNDLKIDIARFELDDFLDDLEPVFNGASTSFARDGNTLWTTIINEPVFVEPVSSADNSKLIVAASNFNLTRKTRGFDLDNPVSMIYFLDKTDGAVVNESDQFKGTVLAPLLLGPDESIFFSFVDFEEINLNGVDFEDIIFKIMAINSDGTTKWANPFVPANGVTSTPVINKNNGMVFLSTSETSEFNSTTNFLGNSLPITGQRERLRNLVPDLKGEVIGLDPSKGTVSKSINVDGFPVSSPAIDEDRNTIYSITSDFAIGKLSPLTIDLFSLVYASSLE